MADSARVASIDALRRLRGAVIRFADEGRSAINETESTLDRTIMWLRNEQIPHWTKQIRVLSEEITRAKSLVRRTEDASFRENAHAVEERIALEQAERRLVNARERLEASRAWLRQLEQLADRFAGRVERLAGQLDADLPNAAARLGRMVEAVESYVQVSPEPSQEGGGASGGAGGAMTRGTGPSVGEVGSVLAWCRPLRGRVLRRADRAKLLDQEPSDTARIWPDAETDELQGTLARSVREMPEPILASERLCVEAGVEPAARGVLIRVPRVDGVSDSGWVWMRWTDEPDTPAGWGMSSAAEVVGAVPDLVPALALPPGYLVVVDRGQIVTVVDHNDTLCVGTDVAEPEDPADGGA